MGDNIIHPLGLKGWQLACQVARLQLAVLLAVSVVIALTSTEMNQVLSFFWGGAVIVLGRWLTALAVFRQAGAQYAAVAMRAVMRGNVCTWALVLCSALLAWKILQLPPAPFIAGLVLATVTHLFMPLIIERTTG